MRAFRLPWALPALAAATPAYLCAQTCPTLLYPDGYGNGGTASCTIPTGTATNRVLADAGTINGNAIAVTVLYGNAIQANAGAKTRRASTSPIRAPTSASMALSPIRPRSLTTVCAPAACI